jgi:AraC-like DNA-binding protein
MASQFHQTHSNSLWTRFLRPSAALFVENDGGLENSDESALRIAPSGANGVVLTRRWTDGRNCGRADSALSAAGRHEVAIALKTTRLKLSRDSHTLFEGAMPAGTLFVADAALPLKIDFQAPCDFIYLSVPSEWFSEAGLGAVAPGQRSLDGFTMRDGLAEGLARSLIDVEAGYGDRYAESVGQTIVMRLLGAMRERPENAGSKVTPLPRWRLKRVQDYVAANIGERISLPELASVAGLSRMHFAAQFRAATGCRPHEYLLLCRIERAKAMLLQQDMPIVEIALSVGFQAQAHFSTVFKRLTSQTPLGWRRASLDMFASASPSQRRSGGEAPATAAAS